MANASAATSKEDLSWGYPLLAAGFIVLAGRLYVKDDDTSNTLQLLLAAGFAAVVGWGYWLELKSRGKELQRLRDRLLLVIGLGGAFAYCNFGHLHFGNYFHVWDTYHYYMGSKYFPEVGYDLLYDCTTVADLEAGGRVAENAKKRIVTDLRDNIMRPTDHLVRDPSICTSHFSAARWDSYKKDVAFFRGRVNDERWKAIHHDHGYNATPVWTLLGWLLSNLGPATIEQMIVFILLDPLYLALAAAMLYWAFGPRVFALSLIMLGCNFPNRYTWTGGAFLRHDWLFYTVAVVCLLKKEKFFLAGLSLAYAALLRLFPGLLAIGPLLAGVEYLRLNKKLDPRFLTFVAGGALGTVLLVGSSFALASPDSWVQFAKNTQKHASTPLSNHMGLRTVLSYRPSTVQRQTHDPTRVDAWQTWKDIRLVKFRELKWAFVLLLLGAAAMIYLGLRGSVVPVVDKAGAATVAGSEPNRGPVLSPEYWVAAAMGVGFITFGAELTCYYYCFMMGVAPLFEKRREVAFALCGMAGLTELSRLLSGGARVSELGADDLYVFMSLASLVAMGVCWWLFTRSGQKNALVEPPPADVFPELALAGGLGGGAPQQQERKKKRR